MTADSDPDLQQSVDRLFETASDPQQIVLGLVAQHADRQFHVVLPHELQPEQLRVEFEHDVTRFATGRARHRAQALYADEAYVLVLESHIRLAPGWDTILKAEFKACPSSKAVLIARAFDSARSSLQAVTDAPPTLVPNFAGGIFFAESALLNEVPFDPELPDEQADVAYLARLFTHGYDVFESHRIAVHRAGSRAVREPTMHERERGRRRLAALFNISGIYDPLAAVDLHKYGLGQVRSLKESAETSDLLPHVGDFREALPDAVTIQSDTDAALMKNKPRFDFVDEPYFHRSQVRGDVPPGIFVLEDYLDPESARKLVDYAETQTPTWLGVGTKETNAGNENFRIDQSRVTQQVPIDGVVCEILNLFNDIYCNRVAPYYRVALAAYERPQILRYTAGGKYQQHADADVWDDDQSAWVRILYRDYSVLLYLNDAYTGGELYFPNQDYLLKPKSGMLVAFPSDYRFSHEARETTGGVRYAAVSWARVMDSKPAKIPYNATHIPLLQARLK